jgi:hypothetical protein
MVCMLFREKSNKSETAKMTNRKNENKDEAPRKSQEKMMSSMGKLTSSNETSNRSKPLPLPPIDTGSGSMIVRENHVNVRLSTCVSTITLTVD